MGSVRLAHISDIHITKRLCKWQRDDWLNKRMAAWLNLRFLGRGLFFRQAERILDALVDDLTKRGPDRVVFSGDATALGFDEEVEHASKLLGLASSSRLQGLAVPGNHDYCTTRAAESGAFESYFSHWLEGERVDGAMYPFAQRVGHAWLIGVNSAKANRWPWDASGSVGTEQLERLDRLLPRLGPGPRIIVTHYPACKRSGRLEIPTHRLHDAHLLADVTKRHGVSLWLHGHLHRPFQHPTTCLTPYPVICAGSSTQLYHWSYGEYTLTDSEIHGVRRQFDPVSGRFQNTEEFTLAFPKPS
jgi:3',5'-cyclic AMP phosphodiesterase CpdA